VTRPFDEAFTPQTVAERREAMERVEQERAASRQRALQAQASAESDPQTRIATWEHLHALSLPRAPEHALVILIARQTRLTVGQVHDEQRRRATLPPP
jgi:hypothetical protein